MFNFNVNNKQVGSDKGLGYTMMTRATFGLWGCLIPLANALIANVVFVCSKLFGYILKLL